MSNNIDTFVSFINVAVEVIGFGEALSLKVHNKFQGNLHCTRCQRVQKFDVNNLYINPFLLDRNISQLRFENHILQNRLESLRNKVYQLIAPSLWRGNCRNCESKVVFVIYHSWEKDNFLAVFPEFSGGIATENTPTAVSFYLDQASKAHSVGANSAAMAMYRAALEQVLFEQGYTVRMLGRKIEALQKDIDDNTSKPWTKVLDVELLKYLKELGDGAIHPNDGDVMKQSTLDNELITQVVAFLSLILYKIYEEERLTDGYKLRFKQSKDILKNSNNAGEGSA